MHVLVSFAVLAAYSPGDMPPPTDPPEPGGGIGGVAG